MRSNVGNNPARCIKCLPTIRENYKFTTNGSVQHKIIVYLRAGLQIVEELSINFFCLLFCINWIFDLFYNILIEPAKQSPLELAMEHPTTNEVTVGQLNLNT